MQVATIAQGPKERLITLLGDTRPYQVATLYGKVGGYLKSIAVDRGDRVKAGQVVAEVESAETDRQYDAAVSDLENKRKNAERAARSGGARLDLGAGGGPGEHRLPHGGVGHGSSSR